MIEYVLASIPYIGWIFDAAFTIWDTVYLLIEVLAYVGTKLSIAPSWAGLRRDIDDLRAIPSDQ